MKVTQENVILTEGYNVVWIIYVWYVNSETDLVL